MKALNLFQFCVVPLASAVLSCIASAATFDYGATANSIEVPSGTLSAVGNAVRVGTFPAGFDFASNASNYTATDDAFTDYDLTTIGTGEFGAGQFFDTTPNIIGITGIQLYIWSFDTSVPASATAWAIVTNNAGNWRGPADAGTTSIDTSDTGVFVPAGALGAIVADANSPVGFDIRMGVVAIPEPSTYALLGLGLSALTFGALRQRRHGRGEVHAS